MKMGQMIPAAVLAVTLAGAPALANEPRFNVVRFEDGDV
jgi:hypothetical protein